MAHGIEAETGWRHGANALMGECVRTGRERVGTRSRRPRPEAALPEAALPEMALPEAALPEVALSNQHLPIRHRIEVSGGVPR
jgi:hypothetical protein